jgi:hypothetical protein
VTEAAFSITGSPLDTRHSEHSKPQTLLTVRREARQAPGFLVQEKQ